jgi:hypothetical protein
VNGEREALGASGVRYPVRSGHIFKICQTGLGAPQAALCNAMGSGWRCLLSCYHIDLRVPKAPIPGRQRHFDNERQSAQQLTDCSDWRASFGREKLILSLA